MINAVTIDSGFAEVGAGAWLMGQAQPAAFFGEATRRRRKGWLLRDRASLSLVETTGTAKCACVSRPFLTLIPCATRITAVSVKILVAPAAARARDELVKVIPMSLARALVVTVFDLPSQAAEGPKAAQSNELTADAAGAAGASAWVVMATAGRTARMQVADGETLSVRPDAVVAWTGNNPTGFVRKLGVWDVLLPRGPRDLLLHFHGPCIVWAEGSGNRQAGRPAARQTFCGGVYGV